MIYGFINTNAQVISLSVSQRDSGLRPEQDTSIQPLEDQPAWLEEAETWPDVAQVVPVAAVEGQAASSGPDF